MRSGQADLVTRVLCLRLTPIPRTLATVAFVVGLAALVWILITNDFTLRYVYKDGNVPWLVQRWSCWGIDPGRAAAPRRSAILPAAGTRADPHEDAKTCGTNGGDAGFPVPGVR
jgi:hypothetical protein